MPLELVTYGNEVRFVHLVSHMDSLWSMVVFVVIRTDSCTKTDAYIKFAILCEFIELHDAMEQSAGVYMQDTSTLHIVRRQLWLCSTFRFNRVIRSEAILGAQKGGSTSTPSRQTHSKVKRLLGDTICFT